MATQHFNWISYYTLANELAARTDEASRRSAISRAYYYVYHLGYARAASNGFKLIDGETSHKQLWRNYSESPDHDCKKLAVIANRLREKRVRADYNKVFLRIDDEIEALIQDAQDFAAGLVALPPRFPDPTHVRQ